jgi:hypothetical protein
MDMYNTIKSFQMKLNLWISKLNENKIHTIPSLAARLEQNEIGTGLNESLFSEMQVPLHISKENFLGYFPDMFNKLFPL